MVILAIDPATSCGWALGGGNTIAWGTWDLSIRRDESSGMRLLRLQGKLNEIAECFSIDLVVFEAARNTARKSQRALVVQSGMQGVIELWCEEHKIQYRGVSPGEVKKLATGKGNAPKELVLAAARKEFGEEVRTTDEADALWLLRFAQREVYDGKENLAHHPGGYDHPGRAPAAPRPRRSRKAL